MLMRENLHLYQTNMIKHIQEHPYAALFAQCGLGKSITTLTALTDLKGTGKILIIAPLRVAQNTWDAEAREWEHTRHLTFSKVLGTARQRKAALARKADIYLVNRENVPWLVAHYGGGWPFKTVVIDELSSFKSTKAARFRALRQVRPLMDRVIGLTGTPSPNGLTDLWGQIYLLDQGERLGRTVTGYRNKYFIPTKQNGHVVYEYGLKKTNDDLFSPDHYEKEIYSKISDICISMKTKDWLTLPERIDVTRRISLSPELLKRYKAFEREKVLELMEATERGKQISAANAAGLTGKLLQFCNGAVYDEDKNWHEMHAAKIEALDDVLESANGKPVLVLYVFRSDVDRIKGHLGAKYGIFEMDGGDTLEKWNNGQIPVLLGHPASMGHGLNMQKGGNLIVHFGLNWSLELYQQAVARLDRQGQKEAVINTRLLCKGTYDEKVLKVLDTKGERQDSLMDAVKALVEEYR